jgi:hypothetical protein
MTPSQITLFFAGAVAEIGWRRREEDSSRIHAVKDKPHNELAAPPATTAPRLLLRKPNAVPTMSQRIAPATAPFCGALLLADLAGEGLALGQLALVLRWINSVRVDH